MYPVNLEVEQISTRRRQPNHWISLSSTKHATLRRVLNSLVLRWGPISITDSIIQLSQILLLLLLLVFLTSIQAPEPLDMV